MPIYLRYALNSLILLATPFVSVLILIWVARKVIARMQDRLGPNNSGTWAGPYALFQTLADAIKILTKELIIPEGADLWVFLAAPAVVLGSALLVWLVIPFGPTLQGMDPDIGIFYVVVITPFALFAMIMAGWSSRNKYAALGTFRAVAQIISYEIPQFLSLLIPIMLTGSLSLQHLVLAQQLPFALVLPIPALIYFLAMTAEVGRLPFEQAEADAEIVAGYFTEYSGMMFGSFYLAEFINNFSVSLIFATLFLGGWRGPWVMEVPLLGPVWLLLKGFLVFLVLMLFWGAMPRLRIDQILNINWKFLTPLALVMLIVVAWVNRLAFDQGATTLVARAPWLFAANLVVGLVTIGLLKLSSQRAQRRRDAQSFELLRE
ncbi:MAG: NADH-quinone oxidoreductase subunit H [Anaerolineae bacterium]|nr:NADH-quinone oxidoreductase subunit H [Anaerolineae bacterium]